MIFYDFLYFHVYKFYTRFGEKGAVATAQGIVGGFQTANAMTLIMLFQFTQKDKFRIEKWAVVVLFLAFQVTTYVRYVYRGDRAISILEKEWIGKAETYRKRMMVALYIYGVVSIFALFGLAIYFGGRSQ